MSLRRASAGCTTRGGAPYTIRIPATTPMKPIVKQSGSAYLYAVGHANGTYAADAAPPLFGE